MYGYIYSTFLSRLGVYLDTKETGGNHNYNSIEDPGIGFFHVAPKNDISNTLDSRNQSDKC